MDTQPPYGNYNRSCGKVCMIEHFNQLTPAEAERLAILSEECGEVVQAIGKILRHGYDSRYEAGQTNREQLELELGDLEVIVCKMLDARDISSKNMETRIKLKTEKIKKYLHHQE